MGDDGAACGDAAAEECDEAIRVPPLRVLVTGLRSRPELNGRVGEARRFVAEKGRWEVFLDREPASASLAVQAANLRAVAEPWLASGSSCSTANVSPFESADFECTALDGKGFGLVARAAIPRGKRLFAERPLLRMKGWDPAWEEYASLDDLLAAELALLSAGDRAAFWALTAEGSGEHGDSAAASASASASAIWETNAIAASDADGEERYSVFRLGSRFNHSCKPNVSTQWIESLGLRVFHAARDIDIGEELCIWYIDFWRERDVRRQELAEKFGFQCCCTACGGSAASEEDVAAIAASDARRGEYRALHDSLPEVAASRPREALTMAARVAALVDAELDGHPLFKKRPLYDAFQVALATGMASQARALMRDAYEAKLQAEGDHEGTRQWAKYAEDPSTHPCPCWSGRANGACCGRRTWGGG
eukprot:TRINITY_DN6835_c0_g1_i1.p1 TRINITY_DN6835_c0_g1~~TRINITY_DN6835_c0_g1_i1.p1  ORF type:complete len:423 (+),score=97.61 TRINITY_DN6835_c0_g1_i1:96-1364(+)